MDALKKGDVGAMEQTKNALIEYADEGIKLLKDIEDFNGDNSLTEACLTSLNFYKKEAGTHSSVLIDFFLKKEKFESIKKAFDGKKEKERTQEDVDQFNEAVNNYNTASGDYNSTNEMLNKSRSKTLDNWNNSSTKFTKKHV
jgi:K+/H+ antiporter YhaU regulatory subunit KhtT